VTDRERPGKKKGEPRVHFLGIDTDSGAAPQRTPDTDHEVAVPYESPRLTRVGTLRDLLAGATGRNDDGMGGFTQED
jgi:hypothetical protein